MRTNTIHTIAVMAVATILFGLVHVNGQTQQQQQQQSQPQSQPQLRHTTNTVGLRDLQYSIAEDADLAATASALYVNETEGNNFDVNETEGNNFDADADVDFDNDEEDNDEIDRSTDKPWGGLIGAALLINVTTLAGVVVVAGHWLRTIICPDTKVKESSRLLLVEVLIPMFACVSGVGRLGRVVPVLGVLWFGLVWFVSRCVVFERDTMELPVVFYRSRVRNELRVLFRFVLFLVLPLSPSLA